MSSKSSSSTSTSTLLSSPTTLPSSTTSTPYGFYRPHSRVYTPIDGPSMTKQSFKAECDIHNILRQYQRTGIIAHITQRQPVFQDLPHPIDFQESLHIIQQAEAAFSELPSSVRDRFGNDPQRLLQAIQDPAMRDELIELGVIAKPPPPREPDPQAPPATE